MTRSARYLGAMFLVCAFALGPVAAIAKIAVVAAWAPPTPVGAPVAAFVSVRNVGVRTDRLIGARSAEASEVLIVVRRYTAGAYRLAPVAQLELPPGAAIDMRPMGAQLRLGGVARRLIWGERIPITLLFERAGAIDVMATVGDGPSAGLRVQFGRARRKGEPPAAHDRAGEPR
ncbi:MAG: copper chaperone PCu(A)C [Neomegalonema sp.]|nr:copper chaperone PCu(A)C [Neomegalonema sp.]